MPRGSVIVTRTLMPQRVQEDALRLSMLNSIGRVSRAARRDLMRTVATWNHRVTFTISKQLQRSQRRTEANYGFTITTTDQIWGWLDQGTTIRRVVMENDYEPKTQVGVLDSFQGGGGIVGFGYQDGIEARGWSNIVAARYEQELVNEVRQAILNGLRNQALPRRGG